jgi:hypothetical protein
VAQLLRAARPRRGGHPQSAPRAAPGACVAQARPAGAAAALRAAARLRCPHLTRARSRPYVSGQERRGQRRSASAVRRGGLGAGGGAAVAGRRPSATSGATRARAATCGSLPTHARRGCCMPRARPRVWEPPPTQRRARGQRAHAARRRLPGRAAGFQQPPLRLSGVLTRPLTRARPPTACWMRRMRGLKRVWDRCGVSSGAPSVGGRHLHAGAAAVVPAWMAAVRSVVWCSSNAATPAPLRRWYRRVWTST